MVGDKYINGLGAERLDRLGSSLESQGVKSRRTEQEAQASERG